jgi:hypothetical protein
VKLEEEFYDRGGLFYDIYIYIYIYIKVKKRKKEKKERIKVKSRPFFVSKLLALESVLVA